MIKMKRRYRIAQLRYFYVVVMAVFTLVLISSIYFVFIRDNSSVDNPKKHITGIKNEAPGPPATAAQLEEPGAKVASKLLANKNYDGYQAYERGLANQYLGKKDFKNANRIMGLVQKNVPAASIQANSYAVMFETSRGLKDKAKAQSYYDLLVAALNKENRAYEVTAYSDELGGM